MYAFRRLPNPVTFVVLTGIGLILSACSTLTLSEGRKAESAPLTGNTASDYAILTCAELAVIETSARQRYSKLPTTGGSQSGQEILLRAQIDEIVSNREALGCPVPRSAQLAAEAEAPVIKAAVEPAKPAAKAAAIPTQPTPARGRFLQIGTYGDPSNAQSAADYFADQGFRAETRLTTSGGQRNHRVLVGPLRTDQDVSRASNAARSFGVNDAFLTDS